MPEHYPLGIEPQIEPEPSGARRATLKAGAVMLTPAAARRSLCARTGATIAMVTFYRWLRDGRVYSIRLGQRIFVPQAALDDLIKTCLAGERF
jgi:hypothetical protein